ncbi:MAG TPA: TerC family protein [Gemmatimonadales bacterium]|nr:TerC family protein [Gemmatimonadales bacterium]
MELGGHALTVWLAFSGLVAVLLWLDLGVLNRKAHVLTLREATLASGGWVALALAFGGFLWIREGATHALEYYAGYLIELSLSVDNLFVFILVFQYFGVPAALQPRVLKWGILGAIIMRAVMIGLGALLLARFTWIPFVFGAILIFTGVRMLTQDEVRVDPAKNPLLRLMRRVLPISKSYHGQQFLVRTRTRWLLSPLVLVLAFVEWTDLVFAIDSIPAVFAVTNDPFIVYSSNVFAILGLRSLFFVLAGAMDRFTYFQPGVSAILIFVGAKMILAPWVHLPILVSLGVIVGILALAIVASWLKNRREERERLKDLVPE